MDEVLDRLDQLEISTWNYMADGPSVRHMGPMAQDFARLFQLGDSDKHIHQIDAVGVTYASIKALHGRVEKLQERIHELQQKVGDLEPTS